MSAAEAEKIEAVARALRPIAFSEDGSPAFRRQVIEEAAAFIRALGAAGLIVPGWGGPVVKFKRMIDDLPLDLPRYASDGAAGIDVQSAAPVTVVLKPGDRHAFPIGFAIELEPGWEAQVRPRSGLAAKHGVTVLNSPGTIDSDYRGEVAVLLVNISAAPVTINPGDRIAQLVIARAERAHVVEAHALTDTVRGEGGFGSTGVA